MMGLSLQSAVITIIVIIVTIILEAGRQLVNGAGAPLVIRRQQLGSPAQGLWSPTVYPAFQLVLFENPKEHQTPNVLDHLPHGAKLVHSSVATSLRDTPKVTSLPGDKPRASKVAASRSHSLVRNKKNAPTVVPSRVKYL